MGWGRTVGWERGSRNGGARYRGIQLSRPAPRAIHWKESQPAEPVYNYYYLQVLQQTLPMYLYPKQQAHTERKATHTMCIALPGYLLIRAYVRSVSISKQPGYSTYTPNSTE